MQASGVMSGSAMMEVSRKLFRRSVSKSRLLNLGEVGGNEVTLEFLK